MIVDKIISCLSVIGIEGIQQLKISAEDINQ